MSGHRTRQTSGLSNSLAEESLRFPFRRRAAISAA